MPNFFAHETFLDLCKLDSQQKGIHNFSWFQEEELFISILYRLICSAALS